MPGRLKSTLNYGRVANVFSKSPLTVGRAVLRDGKTIHVAGPKESLTWKKNPLHIEAASRFYKILRTCGLDKVRIVPVKTDSVTQVQKYFHRPSLSSLRQFVLFKLGEIREMESFVTLTDVKYCEDLIKKFPGVSMKAWQKKVEEAKQDLTFKAGVGEILDFFPESGYAWRFDFRNFIVFGFDKKGTIKCGLVDI